MGKSASANYFAWLVAFIDSEHIHKVEKELAKYPEYSEVEAYIPTVRVLKKTIKKKPEFEEVPLLFNYGFFKVPRRFAIHPNFLENMKQDISCIYSWVKDPAKIVKNSLKKPPFSKSDSSISVATATSDEISRLIRDTFDYSAHSADDLDRLNAGDYIILRGYPFEGMEAQIVEIDPKKETIRVILRMMNANREVTVHFDNVFFTTYHNKNYDDSITTKESLEAMQASGKLDKLTFKLDKKGKK